VHAPLCVCVCLLTSYCQTKEACIDSDYAGFLGQTHDQYVCPSVCLGPGKMGGTQTDTQIPADKHLLARLPGVQ